MPETESKNSRPVVFSFDCNTEFHFIEQKKQQFLYFAGVIATIIFLVFKVEINFSLHRQIVRKRQNQNGKAEICPESKESKRETGKSAHENRTIEAVYLGGLF